jgi:hypothetical protein
MTMRKSSLTIFLVFTLLLGSSCRPLSGKICFTSHLDLPSSRYCISHIALLEKEKSKNGAVLPGQCRPSTGMPSVRTEAHAVPDRYQARYYRRDHPLPSRCCLLPRGLLTGRAVLGDAFLGIKFAQRS